MAQPARGRAKSYGLGGEVHDLKSDVPEAREVLVDQRELIRRRPNAPMRGLRAAIRQLGAPAAITMPAILAADSMRRLPTNIQPMPAIASAIAIQVRPGIDAFSTAQASSAVSSGAIARTISVLAVEVSVSATMKQINIVAHMHPEISPARPARRRAPTRSRRTIAR